MCARIVGPLLETSVSLVQCMVWTYMHVVPGISYPLVQNWLWNYMETMGHKGSRQQLRPQVWAGLYVASSQALPGLPRAYLLSIGCCCINSELHSHDHWEGSHGVLSLPACHTKQTSELCPSRLPAISITWLNDCDCLSHQTVQFLLFPYDDQMMPYPLVRIALNNFTFCFLSLCCCFVY